MLDRVLEPEVMDTAEDAADYDAMDHAAVNRAFAADLLAFAGAVDSPLLDAGTGTALIPIELCRLIPTLDVVAVDAAAEMRAVARRNVDRTGLAGRIRVERSAAQTLPFADGCFPAVVSNSLIHHVPDPAPVLAEMVRVCRLGGVLFVRDLVRPDSETALAVLVATYAGDANPHQRRLFADSLRAALTLDEIRAHVGRLGFDAATVSLTSDRHWTWAARRA